MGDLERLSKATREKAFVLARNARKLNINLGHAKWATGRDYLSYWLYNGTDYIIIFCTPLCYLAELWYENNREVDTQFFAIKNIRHFLQRLKKLNYEDAERLLDDMNDTLDEVDLKTYLEEMEEEDGG